MKTNLSDEPYLIIRSVLQRKVLDNFPAARNASFYTGLRYWLEYVNYFLSTYATTTAIQNKVMCFKDLKQLPRQTEVEFSSRIIEIAYQCGNAFSLENKNFAFDFGLQSNIQTIAAHEMKELENKRRSFESVIEIKQK